MGKLCDFVLIDAIQILPSMTVSSAEVKHRPRETYPLRNLFCSKLCLLGMIAKHYAEHDVSDHLELNNDIGVGYAGRNTGLCFLKYAHPTSRKKDRTPLEVGSVSASVPGACAVLEVMNSLYSKLIGLLKFTKSMEE